MMTKLTVTQRKFILFLILFSLFYFPKIGNVDFTIVLLIPFSIYILLIKRIPINKEVIYSALILFSIQLYVLITSLINQEITPNVLLNPIRELLILLSCYIIIFYLKINFVKIINLLLFIFLLNSILIFLQFFLHIKYGIVNNLYNPEFPEFMVNTVRKPGYFTGYPVAGFISNIGLLSSLYLYSYNKKNYYIFYLVIFFVTSLLTARTALLFNLLVTPFLFLLLSKKHIFIIILTFILGLILLSIFHNDFIFAIFEKIKVVFDLIITQKGDHSTNDLFNNHYRIPQDIQVFIFGNALNPQVFSDVGYIQALFKGGIIIFSLILFFYYYIFAIMLNKSKKDKRSYYFIISIILCFIFYNFKGPYLLSRTVGDYILIIFLSLFNYFIDSSSKNINKKVHN
ncbi:hypothetical protein JEP40_04380 [Proteus vulgaris]|uniref:hypothetical protein n=1 Tax=Proteus vulgaris TaxID=585 RepID=UPI0018E44C37|nr:hypothetical protein [Proteus vulgaris]MBI6528372.1 hypothetical protein [Proteus vulgaris]